MALLTKDAILAADDLPTKDIPVKEWGGTVRIRALTVADMEQLRSELLDAQRDGLNVPPNWYAKHLAMSAVDEKGELVFSESDAAKLGRKSGVAMFRVFEAINAFNGRNDDAVEEAAGN
jgi:hypothetical protein